MNQIAETKSSPLLRISLRAILIAILFIGLIFGFWVLPSLKQKKVSQWVTQNGGDLSYVAEDRAAEFFSKAEYGILEYWPGVDFIDNISSINLGEPISDLSPLGNVNDIVNLIIPEFNGSDLSPLANTNPLESLSIYKSSITQLDALKQLSNLQSLIITHCDLINIQGLSSCVQLRYLDLSNTPLDDIQGLQQLTQLTTLNLSYTKVSDFKPLESLENLLSLSLRGTEISPAELAALKTALPNCMISSD
ncbi:leucine-rich repeat domain-containing protein [Mariniblastus sp.]|nr:leucine-rich repeat domain-containing protein [Mariniblastus sp.]